jgi:hypothetical protein
MRTNAERKAVLAKASLGRQQIILNPMVDLQEFLALRRVLCE